MGAIPKLLSGRDPPTGLPPAVMDVTVGASAGPNVPDQVNPLRRAVAGALTALTSTLLPASRLSDTSAGTAPLLVRVTAQWASWLRVSVVGAHVCVIGTTASATLAATGSTTFGTRRSSGVSVICPKLQPSGAAVPSIVMAIWRVPVGGTATSRGETVTFRPLVPVVVLTLNFCALDVTFCRVR